MKNSLGLSDAEQPKRRIGDDLDGAPWPVRAVAIIGGTTCIACFLVWFLATSVTTALEKIKTAVEPLSGHVDGAKKLGETLERIERQQLESGIRLEGYQRIICEN